MTSGRPIERSRRSEDIALDSLTSAAGIRLIRSLPHKRRTRLGGPTLSLFPRCNPRPQTGERAGDFSRAPVNFHRLLGFVTRIILIFCEPAPYASYPVLVHRLGSLLHAAFRPRLATMSWRFAIASPPSGCEGDLHPRAVEHARHTSKGLAPFTREPRSHSCHAGVIEVRPNGLTLDSAALTTGKQSSYPGTRWSARSSRAHQPGTGC
jgi:hypothetical protein